MWMYAHAKMGVKLQEVVKMTNPEHRAVQKFRVLLAFPVITCVVALPSEVTAPPRSSTIFSKLNIKTQ